MDGEEVVQVYLKKEDDTDGPSKALRAFKRVLIPQGKTVNVELELSGNQFEWWNEKSRRVDVQPGNFEILVGKSSKTEDLIPVSISLQ
jgi:beta-glucosidase